MIFMRNMVNECGRNAGKIWEVLNNNGSLSQTKLIRNTRLKNDEFHSAIGWLARENKINMDDITQNPTYRLGETNLTTKIGGDAGRVWEALNTWGENDIPSIAKYARLKSDEVNAALGWLAREDKIDIKNMKNQKMMFRLKTNGPISKIKQIKTKLM